jgi:hypothetical protein
MMRALRHVRSEATPAYVTRVLQACYKGVTRVCKGVARVLEGCNQGVAECYEGVTTSRVA